MKILSLILLIIWELILAIFYFTDEDNRGAILFLMTYFIIPVIYIAMS